MDLKGLQKVYAQPRKFLGGEHHAGVNGSGHGYDQGFCAGTTRTVRTRLSLELVDGCDVSYPSVAFSECGIGVVGIEESLVM